MEIAQSSTVAEVATEAPATIKVFQQHGIDFCCGGKRPIADACAEQGLDVEVLLGELRTATTSDDQPRNWEQAPLGDLVAHIQGRFHQPLRVEFPRLSAMLEKVVSRHGERLPEMLLPLQRTFEGLRGELLEHMAKEDAILFPAILDLSCDASNPFGAFIEGPIGVMESEHAEAGRALAEMRRLTSGYAPPADACPTFRGLFYGLSEFERDMHEHVHLENNVLFPRAAGLARSR